MSITIITIDNISKKTILFPSSAHCSDERGNVSGILLFSKNLKGRLLS